MAENPKDYRDPKVTNEGSRKNNNWIWITLAVIVVLLILAWILGWFGGDEEVGVVEGAFLHDLPTPAIVSAETVPA